MFSEKLCQQKDCRGITAGRISIPIPTVRSCLGKPRPLPTRLMPLRAEDGSESRLQAEPRAKLPFIERDYLNATNASPPKGGTPNLASRARQQRRRLGQGKTARRAELEKLIDEAGQIRKNKIVMAVAQPGRL